MWTTALTSEERSPTIPTVWEVVPLPLWSVGMTIAAPTNKRMISVPTLKMRPRTRSRISRMATIPMSPSDWSVAARSRVAP